MKRRRKREGNEEEERERGEMRGSAAAKEERRRGRKRWLGFYIKNLTQHQCKGIPTCRSHVHLVPEHKGTKAQGRCPCARHLAAAREKREKKRKGKEGKRKKTG